MKKQVQYDRNFAACESTYASLRIIHKELDPAEVTQLLGVSPTESFKAGDPDPPKQNRVWEHGGWFLRSKEAVISRDLRHHLDWLLQHIGHHSDTFDVLFKRGYLIDVPCFWISARGDGGPVLSPLQMAGFANLDLDVWIDFYNG